MPWKVNVLVNLSFSLAATASVSFLGGALAWFHSVWGSSSSRASTLLWGGTRAWWVISWGKGDCASHSNDLASVVSYRLSQQSFCVTSTKTVGKPICKAASSAAGPSCCPQFLIVLTCKWLDFPVYLKIWLFQFVNFFFFSCSNWVTLISFLFFWWGRGTKLCLYPSLSTPLPLSFYKEFHRGVFQWVNYAKNHEKITAQYCCSYNFCAFSFFFSLSEGGSSGIFYVFVLWHTYCFFN